MNKESLELIENNLIKNRGLVSRLLRLVHRHCVSRNERLYGRDVNLVREWLVSYPYRELDAQQQVAFTLRRDVRHWTRVALEWRGWEEFVGRMMEGTADGGIIKAFVLSCCYDYRHEFSEITRCDRDKEQSWALVRQLIQRGRADVLSLFCVRHPGTLQAIEKPDELAQHLLGARIGILGRHKANRGHARPYIGTHGTPGKEARKIVIMTIRQERA